MKTVVITGSARGLGFNMAKIFRENNVNVIISDLKEENLISAKGKLEKIKSEAKIEYFVCDVTREEDIKSLIKYSYEKFNSIDIWINNAGVNQPDKAIWELDSNDVNLIIDVDLKGTVIASKLIMKEMIKQGNGAIYNIEGYGSNDAHMLGLSIYGTSKRAITYFTESLALESKVRNTNVIIGKLSPGIMITDFITNSLGDKDKINLTEKTKKVYNILGDYPEVVARFFVKRVLKNTKNGVKIEWLTKRKAFYRFLTAGFNKRNFFK